MSAFHFTASAQSQVFENLRILNPTNHNAGPRVLMDCAVDQNWNELESWFINLWNHFVIPYLMGAIMAGIEVGGYTRHLIKISSIFHF